MGLVPRALAFAFGKGLDTKTDPESVQVAAPVALENAVFDRGGALTKRPGYAALAPVPELAAAIAAAAYAPPQLAALDDELLLVGANNLFSHSESQNGWQSRGAIFSPEVRIQGIYASPTEQLRPDCATDGATTVYVYEEGASVKATVIDEATGAVLVSNRTVGTGSRPAVESVGGGRFLIFAAGSARVLLATAQVSSSGVTISAFSNLVTTLDGTRPFFATARLGAAVVLAWATSSGIAVQYVTPAGALGTPSNGYWAPAAVGTATPASALALGVLDDRFSFLAYTDDFGTTVRYLVLDQDLSTAVADTALPGLGGDVASQLTWGPSGRAGAMQLWYERRGLDATYNASVWTMRLASSGVATAVSLVARSVGLATKAFGRGAQPLVGVTYESTVQPTLYVVNASGVVVARTLVGRAGGLGNSYPWTTPGLPSMRLAGDKAIAAVQYRTRLVSQPGGTKNSPRAVGRVSVDFGKERYRSARVGELLHFGGGAPSVYDGAQVIEAGFNVFPELSVDAPNWGVQLEKADSNQNYLYLPKDLPGVVGVGTPCAAQLRAGGYFCLFSCQTGPNYKKAYCYLTIDGVGADPLLNGFDLVLVCDLVSTDDQLQVATKIGRAVTTFASGSTASPFWAGRAKNVGSEAAPDWAVEIDDTSFDATVGRIYNTDDATLMMNTLARGGISTVPVNFIVTPAARWIEPGRWLVLESTRRNVTPSIVQNLQVAFYFTVDGEGSAPDNILGNRRVPVALLSTDNANQVGTKLAAAITAFQEGGVAGGQLFNAAAASSGPLVTVTNIGNGAVAVDNEGRFTNCYVAAGPIGAGTRQYVATYEHTDARGKLHRSAPSPFSLAVTRDGAGQGPGAVLSNLVGGSRGPNRVTATSLRLSRRSGVNVVFWRQAAGRPGVYYRLATVANDPTANSVTFQDTVKDQDLLSAEPLYTTAELANDPPPAAQALVSWQDRLWWGGLDAPGVLWYSKVVPAPSELLAPAWSEALQVQLDTTGGRVVALAVLDDNLVVFQERRILVITGQGANNSGDLAQLPPARAISTDLGCLTADSVVVTPGGVLFQSSKGGIYLLDRSFQLQYAGAAVEALTAAGGLVTSAVAMPLSTQVRFTFAAAPALVFDYYFGQWGTFTRYESTGALALRGQYWRVRADGLVLRETPGIYLDLGVPVSMSVTSAWIHPADLVQGYGRIWRAALLARYRSGHVVELGFAYDGDPTVIDLRTFDAAQAFGGDLFGSGTFGAGAFGGMALGGAYQVRAHLRRQKCRAIRVTVTDRPDASGGESVQFLGLALEVGVLAQFNKLPSNRSARS